MSIASCCNEACSDEKLMIKNFIKNNADSNSNSNDIYMTMQCVEKNNLFWYIFKNTKKFSIYDYYYYKIFMDMMLVESKNVCYLNDDDDDEDLFDKFESSLFYRYGISERFIKLARIYRGYIYV
jgi:hypothetical protein